MTDTLIRPDDDLDEHDGDECYCTFCYDGEEEPEPTWDGVAPLERLFCGRYENEFGGMSLNVQTMKWVDGNDGDPGGFANVEPFMNVSDFRIHDEHQGKGHGRRMLETVIKATPGMDLTLEVWADNVPARSLYESLGFVVTSEWGQGPYFPGGSTHTGLNMRRTA